MPEHLEIQISLARHDERIKSNKEDVERNKGRIEKLEAVVSAIQAEDERRDARIDMFQWFALLIAGGLATLAFAVLNRGILR